MSGGPLEEYLLNAKTYMKINRINCNVWENICIGSGFYVINIFHSKTSQIKHSSIINQAFFNTGINGLIHVAMFSRIILSSSNPKT